MISLAIKHPLELIDVTTKQKRQTSERFLLVTDVWLSVPQKTHAPPSKIFTPAHDEPIVPHKKSEWRFVLGDIISGKLWKCFDNKRWKFIWIVLRDFDSKTTHQFGLKPVMFQYFKNTFTCVPYRTWQHRSQSLFVNSRVCLFIKSLTNCEA